MKTVCRYGMVLLALLAMMAVLAPSGAWSADTIKIGAIYPLTGGSAAEGRELGVVEGRRVVQGQHERKTRVGMNARSHRIG